MGAGSYRPIAFLSLTRTLLSWIFSEKLHMQTNCVLADEQKRCSRKISWEAKDQLLIDKAVLREVRGKDKFCQCDGLIIARLMAWYHILKLIVS